MYYSDLPRVRDGALRFTSSAANEQTSVLVGSAEWYQSASSRSTSFGFEDQIGRSVHRAPRATRPAVVLVRLPQARQEAAQDLPWARPTS